MGRFNVTDREIKSLEAQSKSYKYRIDSNFYLVVYPSGTKSFRMRAFNNRTETTLTIGNYPDLSLKEAREQYHKIRVPGTLQNYFKQKDSNTFRSYAEAFMAKKIVSEDYAKDRLSIFKTHIFPHISELKLHEIRPSLIQKVVSDIQASGKVELGHRCLTLIKQVFEFSHSDDNGIHVNFGAIRKFLLGLVDLS